VDSQSVSIANGNQILNFIVQPCGALRVTTTTLPDGQVNNFYSAPLAADSCNRYFSWSLAPNSGPMPDGLSLNPWGDITGTPSKAGTFNLSVRVNDGTATADKALSIKIIGLLLDITSTGLLYATNGVSFNVQLQATGGTTPYTWSLTPGSASLPSGLTLSASGQISGTPTATGEFGFRVRVTDASAATSDEPFFINVRSTPVVITTTTLPNGTVGVPYSAFLQALGGQPPLWWGLAADSAPLPQGLSMSAGTGEIFGTPTTAGAFYFFVNVNDQSMPSFFDEQLVSLTVNAGEVVKPVLASAGVGIDGKFQFLINGTQGTLYTIQFSTDLQTWGNLRNTNAPSESFVFVADLPSTTCGYYRIRVGP
jgi:hypothetical protein